MSWEAFIVPYLEQDKLAAEIRAAVPNIRRGNLEGFLFSTVIPAYSCPSDAYSKSPHDFLQHGLVAFTSYLGVEGTNLFRLDGCLYEDSDVRFAEIRDGISNTLLVGERPATYQNPCYSIWYTGLFSQWHPIGSCASVLGAREVMIFPARGCKHEPSHFRSGQLGNECDFYHFWSLHGGGANFLFADGSVHFLGYASDDILPSLATRDGGEVIGDY